MIVNGAQLVAGENLVFDGSAETDGSFFIYASMGTDTLIGGAGADVFFVADGRFQGGDSFVGGAGADILVLRGNYGGASPIRLSANTISGIETISLLSASDTRFFADGTRYAYSVTTNDGNVAAGGVLTVNGNSLLVDEFMNFDGSAETDGAFRLFGGSANDVLRGGGGGDLIYGGRGGDLLDGRGGADTFRYQDISESTVANSDFIDRFKAVSIRST